MFTLSRGFLFIMIFIFNIYFQSSYKIYNTYISNAKSFFYGSSFLSNVCCFVLKLERNALYETHLFLVHCLPQQDIILNYNG